MKECISDQIIHGRKKHTNVLPFFIFCVIFVYLFSSETYFVEIIERREKVVKKTIITLLRIKMKSTCFILDA